jgi:uridine phosphorylase
LGTDSYRNKKIGRAFKIIRAHKIMNNALKASELILNPDGSIYHLNLLPEDIAPTIFLVGDQNRVPEISKHFDFIELKKSNREFIAHTGYIGDKRLTELDALVNIDFGLREIKAEKQSLQLIRIGTSGSLQLDIEINSILVSEFGLGLDHLLHFYALEHDIDIEKKIKEHLDLPFIDPYFVKASDSLLNLFSNHFRTGITASCPGFYAPQGRMLRGQTVSTQLISKLNTLFIHQQVITNFEMETASIYGMAKVLGHQAISVNCILANRISNQFSTNPQAVIHKAIQEVIDVYLNQK